MTLDWANEEYVRVYTRETTDDLELTWEARAIWDRMMTKFDRSGLIPARNGWESLARLIRIPFEVVSRFGPELVRDGRVQMVAMGFFAPNFVEAQSTSKADKARQRESRERRRKNASSPQLQFNDIPSAISENVTSCHSDRDAVTLCSADPLLCDPSADPLPRAAPARARDPGVTEQVPALQQAAPGEPGDHDVTLRLVRPSPASTQPFEEPLTERERSKRKILDLVTVRYVTEYNRCKRELASPVLNLSPMDKFTALSKLLDDMVSLDSALERCEYAIGIRAAEAIAERTMSHFGEVMWTPNCFNKALTMTEHDVRAGPPAKAPRSAASPPDAFSALLQLSEKGTSA